VSIARFYILRVAHSLARCHRFCPLTIRLPVPCPLLDALPVGHSLARALRAAYPLPYVLPVDHSIARSLPVARCPARWTLACPFVERFLPGATLTALYPLVNELARSLELYGQK